MGFEIPWIPGRTQILIAAPAALSEFNRLGFANDNGTGIL